jgi:hypothetical protein
MACGSGQNGYPVLLPTREFNAYGYIDGSGSERIAPQFAYALPFSEGLGAVNVGGTRSELGMPTDGKWGFIDPQGRFVINPTYYSPVVQGAPYSPDAYARVLHHGYEFSEGLAPVRVQNRWVYIDTAERIVIDNPRIRSPRRFQEGLANVYIDGRWGYMNRQGEIVIEPRFLFPVSFRNGLAVVVDETGKRILINRQGQRLLPQYQLESQFYDGIATIRERFRGESSDVFQRRTYGMADTSGRILFEPQFDAVGRCGEGLCPVLVGSRAGHPIEYPAGVTAAENPGGRWGYVNYGGGFAINPVYEGARGFSEGLAAVQMGGLWGYINASGSLEIDYQFSWPGYFRNGMAAVRLGAVHGDYAGRMAYISSSGRVFWVEPE